MAQGYRGVTVMRWLCIRFPLEVMNYYVLKFSFLRSGTEVQNNKKSLPLSSAARNASKNRPKVGNGVF